MVLVDFAAAKRHGIETKWASEIEPFPIRVTRKPPAHETPRRCIKD